MKIVGTTGLGGLWALERARHICVSNLRCVQGYESKSEIPILYLDSFRDIRVHI